MSARKFAALSRPYSPQQQASCALDNRTGPLKCRNHLTSREACCSGDIFSPVCFIAGLDRIFKLYDHVNPGMTVSTGAHTVRMAKFEYTADAALIDKDAGQATARVTSLASGSIADAAMIISTKKSKVMHIHKTIPTNATTEADVPKLNLSHKCESCAREFTKLRSP